MHEQAHPNSNFSSALRNVFLGLAYDKLNKNDESEQAYLAATRIKDGDRTAWQGLITLYEKQNNLKLDAWHVAALRLAQIFADAYVSTLLFVLDRTQDSPTHIPVMTNTAARM